MSGALLDRRALLRLLAAAGIGVAISPRAARAMGEPAMGIARLAIPGLPDPRPGAFSALLDQVNDYSSIEASTDVPEVDPASAMIFDRPFLAINGDRGFDPLPDEAVANLRLFLREGGFLFIDDASGRDHSDFDACIRRELPRLLPGSPLRALGRDHAVYRSFFLMRTVSGRIIVQPHLEGIWLGDITPVIYSRNDLCGAWMRSVDGSWAYDVVPGGERQRNEAHKLGINIVLFALTSNYKRDAVHVKTLLERMRRQGGYAE